MELNFPLKFKHSRWPLKKLTCGVCKSSIDKIVVYLNAGAMADLSLNPPALEAFWHCGIHTSGTDCRDNVDIPIVDKLHGDQFDLSFCSVKCLRDFFLTITQQLESRRTPVSSSKNPVGLRKAKSKRGYRIEKNRKGDESH